VSAEEPRIYPCRECGVMRTKSEGGTIFTVCDACWDRLHPTVDQPATTNAPPECKLCSRPGRSIGVEIDGKIVGTVDLCDSCAKEVSHHLTLAARS
jgi:hypothetical protein